MIEVPFNPSGRHPAPFLDVYLMAVGSGRPVLCAGQLDTGAERTVIPQWVADQLQLPESAPIHFEAVDGSVGTLRTFRLVARAELPPNILDRRRE